jgi:hypothetical protein
MDWTIWRRFEISCLRGVLDEWHKKCGEVTLRANNTDFLNEAPELYPFTHFSALTIFSLVRFLQRICDDFPLRVERCMNRRKDKPRTRATGSVAAGLGYLYNTWLEFLDGPYSLEGKRHNEWDGILFLSPNDDSMAMRIMGCFSKGLMP